MKSKVRACVLFRVTETLQSVSSAFHNQTSKENETVVTSQLSRFQERGRDIRNVYFRFRFEAGDTPTHNITSEFQC